MAGQNNKQGQQDRQTNRKKTLITTEQTQRTTKPRNKTEIHKFWDFVSSKEGNTAELILYGEISSYSWYGDEITPKQFNEDLKEIGAVDEITVRINSGGGDVFAANAIYTRLREHKAKIIVKIDGWAASAATIIASAGDSTEIAANGVYMVHDPSAGVMGYFKASELTKIADELEVIKQSIVNCYKAKTGKTDEEIKQIMTNETFYTGEEAVNENFCDVLMFSDVVTEVENDSKIFVNSVEIDLSNFKTVPKGLLSCGSNFNNNKELINQKEDSEMTIEELRAKHPELIQAIRNEITQENGGQNGGKGAADEAVNAERERIKGIDDCTLPGFENLAEDAKFKNPISAEQFAMQQIKAQKKQGSEYLSNRDSDVVDSGITGVPPQNNEGMKPGGEDTDPFGDIINGMYPTTK